MRASKNSTPWVLALLAMSLMLAPVSLKAVIEGDTVQVLPQGIIQVPLPEDILFFGPDGRVRVIVMLSETPLHLRGYHRYPDKYIPTLALPRLIQAVENLAVPRAQKQPLLNFLRQALDALNRPLQDPAREALFPLKLNLFIKRVEFLAGPPQNLIPPATAADLIQTAQELILAFASDNELARDKAVIAAEQAGFLEALYLLEQQYAQDHGIDPSTVPYPEPTFQFTNLLNAVVVMITPELFAEAQELPNVVQVEYDRKVEALQTYDWGVKRVYGDSVPQIEAGCGEDAQGNSYRGQNTTIAIVDTGVQLDHPDLAANIALNDTEISVACGVTVGAFDLDHDGLTILDMDTVFKHRVPIPSCLKDNALPIGQYTIDDLMFNPDYVASPCTPSVLNPLWDCQDPDQNGYKDDLVGWNFVDDGYPGYDSRPRISGLKDYHGTHVAGIAAANGDYKGVAPYARILSVRVISEGYSGNIIAGMSYVAHRPNGPALADIINLSLGTTSPSFSTEAMAQALDNLIDDANPDTPDVIGVASAGNKGSGYYTIGSPGTSLKAITVGNSNGNKDDSINSGSSRGPVLPENDMKPDLLAPGTGICAARYSGIIEDREICDYPFNQHIYLSGTSMAAPHVAGAAAALVSRFKAEGTAWTPQKVKDILKQSAVDITKTSYISPFDQGAGRLDIPAACSLSTLLTPTHQNFGFVDFALDPWTSARSFKVLNHTGVTQTYSWSVDTSLPHWDSVISVTVSPPEQTVQDGDSAIFTVQLSVPGSVPVPTWQPPTYETRLILSRQASGELQPTEVTRPWILFSKACKITVEATGFEYDPLFIIHTDTKKVAEENLSFFEVPVNCNNLLHVTLFAFKKSEPPAFVLMAKENLNPLSQPVARFVFPDDATNDFWIEPQDRFGNLLPYMVEVGRRYSGILSFIRPAGPGNPCCGWYVSSVSALSQTNNFSSNWNIDFNLVATNLLEFYSVSGRKSGMDEDTTYTIYPANYRAPWFQFPRSTCNASTYQVRANTNFQWSMDWAGYVGADFNIYPYYLDFPAGSFAKPLWFTPTLGTLEVAHNLVFSLKEQPGAPWYWSRALDSQTVTSPLNSYRLNLGIGFPNVKPHEVLDSETLTLLKGPFIWYAAFNNYSSTAGTGGVEISWEHTDNTIIENPWTPMFATPQGDFSSEVVNLILTEPDGVTTRNLSRENILRPRIWAYNVPFGQSELEAVSPPYLIAGVPGVGNLLAEFTLTFPMTQLDDYSPPFIRKFDLLSNGQPTDIFSQGKSNLVRFNLGDKTRSWGPPGIIANVELNYQILGTSDWQLLNLIQDGSTWSTWIDEASLNNPSDKVWINLKLEAVDNYGNSLTYTMTPAFMFNPWTDYDGDGVEDIHEDNDANDTYTNKPTSDWQEPEPHGLPGKCPGACYFADADGNGMIDRDDWQAVSDYLDGYPWTYDNINPPSPNVQDLDGNTILGVPDLNLYNLILNNRLVSLPGAPAYIDVVSPLDVPEVAVGDTIPIEVNVLNYLDRGRAGLGVAFEVISGQATLLGGDGPAYACSPYARYDISAIILQYGKARMVVQVDGEGPILVDVYIPADPILKFPLVQVDAPVEITGVGVP